MMYNQMRMLTCPNPYCRCRDHVQKVSAIVAAGTSANDIDVHVRGYHLYGSGENQTILARRLSLPPRPTYHSPWGDGSLIVLLILGIIALLGGIPLTVNQGVDGTTTIIIGIFVVAIFISPLIIFLWYQSHRASKRIAWVKAEMPRWQAAFARWDQLYYCHNCDSVFPMDRTRWCPAPAMHSLL